MFIDLDKMPLKSPKFVSLYIKYQRTKPANQKSSYAKTKFLAKNLTDSDDDSENDSVQDSNPHTPPTPTLTPTPHQ